jgi:hypothetical protein
MEAKREQRKVCGDGFRPQNFSRQKRRKVTRRRVLTFFNWIVILAMLH